MLCPMLCYVLCHVLCYAMSYAMSYAIPCYEHRLRLEDLVSKKNGPALWRQLFKFLQLQEKGSELSAEALALVQRLELRGRVHNRAAPGWVRARIAQNASL